MRMFSTKNPYQHKFHLLPKHVFINSLKKKSNFYEGDNRSFIQLVRNITNASEQSKVLCSAF